MAFNSLEVFQSHNLVLPHRFMFKVSSAHECDRVFKYFIKGRKERSEADKRNGGRGYTVRYIPDYNRNIVEIGDDSYINANMLIRAFKSAGLIKEQIKYKRNSIAKKVLEGRRD